MKNYYNLFVMLSMQQCTHKDYTCKEKVKNHNRATHELEKLQREMNNMDCSNLLYRLLAHQDDRVKINAASFCFRYGSHKDTALSVLNHLKKDSNDPTIRFSANTILQNRQDRELSETSKIVTVSDDNQ